MRAHKANSPTPHALFEMRWEGGPKRVEQEVNGQGCPAGRSVIVEGPMKAPNGLLFLSGYFDHIAQRTLVEAVLASVERAPFYTPRLPRTGAAMSVQQTNLGPLGWVTDQAGGYRYEAYHPLTGAPWPEMEACLVNLYRDRARMGLHVDADEAAVDAPVVSVSLGDTAVFRVGGPARNSATRSMRLASGDVIVLGGASRRWFHGVDRIISGTSRLIPDGGRLNLTLRRVTPPSDSLSELSERSRTS
jgi:DNA oxidative demethylase